MPPSKKIFVGSSLVISAILLQVIMGFVANQLINNVDSIVKASGSMEGVGAALDGAHHQSTILFAGFGVVWLLLASGMIFFAIGVFQNSKATEALQARIGQ